MYAPLKFPSLHRHSPRLEELLLNKPFDSNTPGLLPPYYPLQRLYLHDFSMGDLVELTQKIMRGSPKHLRRMSVGDY